MDNFNNYDDTKEEIQFLRKMVVETTNISKDWQKTIWRIIISLSIVLTIGIIGCSLVCKMYLDNAYKSKSSSTTNINHNINENK